MPHVLNLALICFLLPPSSFILAGTLRTLDGRTLEGELKLEQSAQVSVIPLKGKPEKIDLADVLQATFRNTDAPRIHASTDNPAVITTENGKLPAPWQLTDIGDVANPGYARYTNGDYSIKSAGAVVAGTRDAFAFVNQPVGVDADVTARLISVADPRQVAAGLMIRCSPEPDSAYAALFVVGNELRFLCRTRTGGPTDGGVVAAAPAAANDRRAPPLTIPLHLKLTRRANTVTAFASKDGESWQQLGSDSLPAAAANNNVLAGLAVAGRGDRLLGAHFDKFRLISIALTAAGANAATEPPRALKPGVMLTSGTLIAGAEIDRAAAADETTLRYTRADRRDTVSLANVARVVFRDLSPEQAAKIPPNRAGVLLKEGDFVEGEYKGLARDGRIQLSSVLFGLAKFEPRDKAAALILHDVDPTPRDARMTLRTTDGSLYIATTVTPDKDKLVIEDPAGCRFEIDRWNVTDIAAGPGRLQSLAALKPASITPPEALSIDSTGVGLPMTVAGVTAARGLTLNAGAAAAWDLAGNYRTLTFKCGVPTGILPTTPVRFIVLADGRELFKSKPRTSTDDPLTASLSIKDAKTLTLKVESTTPVPLPTPGLWIDPALVR